MSKLFVYMEVESYLNLQAFARRLHTDRYRQNNPEDKQKKHYTRTQKAQGI